MDKLQRRYDIDFLRVIAIALLLVYHTAIGVQNWGLMIGFITNKQSWPQLWTPMSMLNIWRIPLLFFVSGMGVFFAIQKRNWVQLLKERTKRILVPFVFGIFCIVPIHMLILQYYYGWQLSYKPSSSHLWFLGNIFIYTVVFLPIFIYLKKNKEKTQLIKLRSILSHPIGLIMIMLLFVVEAIVIKPHPYALYAMTIHGFVLGMLAFLCGFMVMYSGQDFWKRLCQLRWLFLILASVLYVLRMHQAPLPTPGYRLSIESTLWIFSVCAFGHKHLNKNSTILNYLSQSAYPVYIIHMVILYASSFVIFPLNIDVKIKFLLITFMTLIGSLAIYELFIRRFSWMRIVFGLKKL